MSSKRNSTISVTTHEPHPPTSDSRNQARPSSIRSRTVNETNGKNTPDSTSTDTSLLDEDSVEKPVVDPKKIDELVKLNEQIQDSIEAVQDRCLSIARQNEIELVKRFQEKLADAQKEIEELKKKEPELDAHHWMHKYKESVNEVEKLRAEAIRLDKLNDILEKEVKMLRTELHAGQSELDHQTMRMSSVVRRSQNLSEALQTLRESRRSSDGYDTAQPALSERGVHRAGSSERSTRGAATERSRGGAFFTSQQGNNRRYAREMDSTRESSVRQSTLRSLGASTAAPNLADPAYLTPAYLQQQNDNLRQLVAKEKRNASSIRNSHLQALAQKTELQVHLQQCIAETEAEMARNDARRMKHTPESRRRVMELLLSRKRVLDILNDKQYPTLVYIRNSIANISGQSEEDLLNAVFARERAVVQEMREKGVKTWVETWREDDQA
ncbi:hypothetical protein BLNAU_15544 [Blattamonas nauphoetae]|uniref:Uncharacterized protein n=1 Tax=Blattamonas nauphoetae TaxID=2049346 RepID=A0ABQ9XE24_9EUKA|nr:hypothetical protein BLNAU_15544 [Blattamonas nauphoetae]